MKRRTLRAAFPRVAKEWHPTRNGDLSAETIPARTSRKVWWRCARDASHEWQATVHNRTNGNGCPFCSGRVATPETSLATLHPEVAAQWHPTRNRGLGPHQVRPGSHRRVFWRCPRDPGHVWQTDVKSRATSGSGCPVCAGRVAALSKTYPRVAAEWHLTRNGARGPDSVPGHSRDLAWWQCRRNPEHVWRSLVVARTRLGGGCPVCKGLRAGAGNNLAELYPVIAAQWHLQRNGALRPEDVLPGTHRRVFWRCPANARHVWAAQVVKRTAQGTGCPWCRRDVALPETSLAVRHPELARQWHATKNGRLRPEDLRLSAITPVWWRCDQNPRHSWTASIPSRLAGSGCPTCGGLPLRAQTLATREPLLAAEWDQERNGDATPGNVAISSRKIAFWRCAYHPEHRWTSSPAVRVESRRGCPHCRKRLRDFAGSVAAAHPKLAREWHPSKNAPLRPADVLQSSEARMWWRCARNKSHVWQAGVRTRVRGSACPACSGRRATPKTSVPAGRTGRAGRAR